MPDFISHNIRLADGTRTNPALEPIEQRWIWLVYRRLFQAFYPSDRQDVRVVDLGCFEVGYSVELARIGFDVMGIECRAVNFAACEYVRDRVNLPNLQFVHDDAINLAAYGMFDAVLCSGLLYHLENPRAYLATLAAATRSYLILNTHYAYRDRVSRHPVSDVTEHEGLPGRWYGEFPAGADVATRDEARLSSWKNNRSFWVLKDRLVAELCRLGFDVFERADGGDDLENRGTFVCLKRR